MPYYLSKINVGLDKVASLGDGTSFNLQWFRAYPENSGKIAYNIYYSTNQDTVFSEGPKLISIDAATDANIIDLIPGQMYWFGLRPIEYSSLLDLSVLLPVSHDNIRFFPTSILSSNITAADLNIPLLDVEGFPNTGIIKIGYELIEYSSINLSNLVLTNSSQRGMYGTDARIHNTDGYDGVDYRSQIISLYLLGESNNFDRTYMCQSRFEYPNNAFLITDGYYQVTTDTLTTDLSSSDESNEDFPSYDYAGYHRIDPVDVINGTCVGSYIGGEYGCIDGYGNYNIIRGISVQDRNNQRQEMLLNSTGKPVVLLQRQHTGIVCACYMSNSEYPDDRCPKCFAEGTLVRAEKGLISIENINIGDKVLSSDGKYYKVTQIFKTPFDGKLKAITTTTTTNPILTTYDHPFLKLETDHKTNSNCGPNSNCKAYIERGDGQNNTIDIKELPSGRWHARVQVKNHKRVVLGTFNTKEEAVVSIENYKSIHSKPSHRLDWVDAKYISKNNWLVSKWNTSIIDISKIKIPGLFLKNTKLGSKRLGNEEFIVDEEFLWIIGIYIAEGSNNKRSINFALHEKELDYQNKIISFFIKNGYNPKLYHSKNSKGVTVEVHSSSLAKWFPELCGKLSINKQIPEQFMSLPDNKISAIIKGIWDGDGSKRENEIIQTSEKLCLQIAELLHRLGKQPLITQVKNNILTPKGNKRKQSYRINWEEDTATHINRKGRWKFYDQLLNKVKKVEDIDYSGYVYNLEVEGDHTYVVQNILVHNCLGTKFVLGYNQYFNPRRADGRIMVRTGPTEENLKMYEAGLESEYPLDLWTLTVPTIKNRDVLIMFDIDGNEEFRYEVMGVTRNNTFLGLQGAQKLKVTRIRKTDVAYQISAFKDTSTVPIKLNTSIGFSPGIIPHTHTLVSNENSSNTWAQLTSVSQAHNHEVKLVNGILQISTVLGHSHNIIY